MNRPQVVVIPLPRVPDPNPLKQNEIILLDVHCYINEIIFTTRSLLHKRDIQIKKYKKASESKIYLQRVLAYRFSVVVDSTIFTFVLLSALEKYCT